MQELSVVVSIDFTTFTSTTVSQSVPVTSIEFSGSISLKWAYISSSAFSIVTLDSTPLFNAMVNQSLIWNFNKGICQLWLQMEKQTIFHNYLMFEPQKSAVATVCCKHILNIQIWALFLNIEKNTNQNIVKYWKFYGNLHKGWVFHLPEISVRSSPTVDSEWH